MKKILLALFVLSTLFAQAQKKNASNKSTKKKDTAVVKERPVVIEKDEEVVPVVEEIKMEVVEAPVAVAADEPVRIDNNLDGNESYYIYNSYRDRNLVIAYKGNDYDNRRYALLEYFTRKKITPFIFESISGSFYEGELVQVRLNGKYGVIDQKGKMIIPCIYEEMNTVTIDAQNYFIVARSNRQGVINEQNEVIVPFEYDNIARSYSSPIHLVVTQAGKSGVLNFVSHKMVLPMQYDRIEILGSSGNMIKVRKGNEYTLVSMAGEKVFDNWYQRLDINDDQTVVVDQKGKKALITLAEKKITGFEFDALERVYSARPYLYIAQKAGKYGVIASDGKVIIPLQYDLITNPRENQFIASKGAKKGLIGFDGKEILPLEYDDITYADRYLVIKKNGKAGLLNREGTIVLPVEYDVLSNVYFANDYNSTLFLGAKNGKKGMIDALTGKTRLEFIYDDIIGTRRNSYSSTESFNNTIIAMKNGKYGMIEMNGSVVIPFEYEDLQYLNSFIVIAKKNGKYGIRDIYNGTNILLPFEYQFVNHRNNVIIAYKEAYEKYRLSGTKITRTE